ncbi:unnamed protein product [marine sediment metagenome]|uniref:Acyl-CoA dehydrogenase/oxidase N-terminal domain-containing protein n=1 Tax=marine sediment metagenome TaxID=412755 RepID=X1D9J6_9ZZZZ
MDFKLAEEDKMIRTTIRDFAKKELEPIADRLDQKSSLAGVAPIVQLSVRAIVRA